MRIKGAQKKMKDVKRTVDKEKTGNGDCAAFETSICPSCEMTQSVFRVDTTSRFFDFPLLPRNTIATGSPRHTGR